MITIKALQNKYKKGNDQNQVFNRTTYTIYAVMITSLNLSRIKMNEISYSRWVLIRGVVFNFAVRSEKPQNLERRNF